MELAIGYDTTIANKGTIQDAFHELSEDIKEARGMKAKIRYITYPSNMSEPQVNQLRTLAPDIEFRAGPQVKEFADGNEEYLFERTIIMTPGGARISTLNM